MPRFKLRTLLIVLAIAPPIAGFGYLKWKMDSRARAIIRLQQEEFAGQQKKAAARHAGYLLHVQQIRNASEVNRAQAESDELTVTAETTLLPPD
jgi:hypothetical protein